MTKLQTLQSASTGALFMSAPSRFAELRGRATVKSIPFHAQLYVIHACNLKCEHCFESEETHPTDQDDMSLEEIDGVLESLAGLGTLQLTITGGEIFLRRDILDIVALAKKRRFMTTLFTSGYHIDEAKADRLAELGVDAVDVSVYSHDPAIHDGFTRIPGSHKRALRALELLHERGVKTAVKTTVLSINIDHLDAIVAMADSLGAKFALDPELRPRMNGDRTVQRFTVPPDELAAKLFSRPDLYGGASALAPTDICHGHEEPLPGDDRPMCGAGRSTLAVLANGEVQPCGFFPVSVGNVRQTPLHTIWTQSAFLDEVRGTSLGAMDACPSCELKGQCHPCMAASMMEHGHHRGCNSASKNAAEGIVRSEANARRADEKQRRGRALPLLSVDVEVGGPGVVVFE